MLELKDYQEWALDALKSYFQECVRTGDANVSFYSVTAKTMGANIPYKNVAELPGLPYVCLRIPTGGGKTIVACHSIGTAAKELVRVDRPMVLWLVPSNAILEQTHNALRDRSPPYHQAVGASFGAFNVLNVEQALYMKRAHLDAETTIIITTMQSFRVEDTVGRRVYKDSGDLMDHFAGLAPHVLDGLEKGQSGNLIHSLANVLRVRRPILVVDEAHNARTSLSFETLARFYPSCIIEFTAIPTRDDHSSNVLFSASAADLKTAQMIKLPIRLQTRPDWKELLSDVVHCLNRLEKTANMERQYSGEYIRPIMLIQAQPQRKEQETLTVDVVKQCLVTDFNIPEEQIAVATGATKELEGVDIASPDTPIRYVITIQALREGWDYPFAYVLCSLAESRSATAVEQILGRVLRLPGAHWKQHDELNMAYAFAASASFAEVANTLTDALVQNGFERQEAKDLIVHSENAPVEIPLFDDALFGGVTKVTLQETPRLEALSLETGKKVTFNPDTKELYFTGEMSELEREEIKGCCATYAGKEVIDQAFYVSSDGRSKKEKTAPSEKQIPFKIPVLALRQGGLFEQFEETHFLDHPWELAKCDAFLTEGEFSTKRPAAQAGEIDVMENGHIAARFHTKLHSQMELFANDSKWGVADLVYWLDRSIAHQDISAQDSGIFINRVVQILMAQRKITLEQLLVDKYRLKKAVENKIDSYRRAMKNRVYQKLLFDDESSICVSTDICFSFAADPKRYAYSLVYKGRYVFQKHYYPQIGDLKPQGEEFECAQYIDQMDEIEFWVRNPVRRPGYSFWLQTSTDKFYPDFVCKLKDGRILVVEYKGEHLWDDESKEKKALGELWAKRSGGKCLFVMPTERRFAEISKAVN
ncbi:MAG: DEAD/DEAH box helicase family protein [Desulfobacteraceae bacterium]|nr:DEAD/DEAH box helicase family protein [Desulfobacteraceae bacterium]